MDRAVSEFIRITDQLLPKRVFTRIVPELLNGGLTQAGTPVRPAAAWAQTPNAWPKTPPGWPN